MIALAGCGPPLNEPAQELMRFGQGPGAMALVVLNVGGELGEGFAIAGRDEERVVAGGPLGREGGRNDPGPLVCGSAGHFPADRAYWQVPAALQVSGEQQSPFEVQKAPGWPQQLQTCPGTGPVSRH